MRPRQLVLAGALAVLASAACGAGGDGESASSSTSRAPALVSSNVLYASVPEGWVRPVLDLYLPPDAGEPPIAVIVPDAGADPTSTDSSAPGYVALARGLADSGVAAAVLHWGVQSAALRSLGGRDVTDLVAQREELTNEVSCAVRFAASTLGLRQASPARRVVVVGHGEGANTLALAVLRKPRSWAPCFAPEVAPHVSAALLWDGDWLGARLGDTLGSAVSTFLPAYSPWPAVDSLRASTFVEVGVNAHLLQGKSVEVGPTSSYLTDRDPDGSMTDDLDRAGAFDDGAVDPVDVTRAFAIGLRDAGIQSRERELHGEGDPETLGPRVRALIEQSVVQLTRP